MTNRSHGPRGAYRRVVRAGKRVVTAAVPQVGDPCRLCGRPIVCVGLTTCSDCGRAHVDYVRHARRSTRPWGVTLEPLCDSMERRAAEARREVEVDDDAEE